MALLILTITVAAFRYRPYGQLNYELLVAVLHRVAAVEGMMTSHTVKRPVLALQEGPAQDDPSGIDGNEEDERKQRGRQQRPAPRSPREDRDDDVSEGDSDSE